MSLEGAGTAEDPHTIPDEENEEPIPVRVRSRRRDPVEDLPVYDGPPPYEPAAGGSGS